MKINVEIDCTPEEARSFLGLPDVAPMQEALMNQIKDRMEAALGGADVETLFKTWLPQGIAGLEQLQKSFWSQMTGGSKKRDDE